MDASSDMRRGEIERLSLPRASHIQLKTFSTGSKLRVA
jgi:hypothetical protein